MTASACGGYTGERAARSEWRRDTGQPESGHRRVGRMLLGEGLDAAEAAFRVGYESPSQFSREYRRMFGAAPGRGRAQGRSSADDLVWLFRERFRGPSASNRQNIVRCKRR